MRVFQTNNNNSAELREDDITNRAVWRKKVISYITAMMGQARDNDEDDAIKQPIHLQSHSSCIINQNSAIILFETCISSKHSQINIIHTYTVTKERTFVTTRETDAECRLDKQKTLPEPLVFTLVVTTDHVIIAGLRQHRQ